MLWDGQSWGKHGSFDVRGQSLSLPLSTIMKLGKCQHYTLCVAWDSRQFNLTTILSFYQTLEYLQAQNRSITKWTINTLSRLWGFRTGYNGLSSESKLTEQLEIFSWSEDLITLLILIKDYSAHKITITTGVKMTHPVAIMWIDTWYIKYCF